jgi:hypothetical protein
LIDARPGGDQTNDRIPPVLTGQRPPSRSDIRNFYSPDGVTHDNLGWQAGRNGSFGLCEGD